MSRTTTSVGQSPLAAVPKDETGREPPDSTAVLCHKLRTPLTSAMGFVQLLKRTAERTSECNQVEQLHIVEKQLRLMAQIIDELAAKPGLA